MRRSSPQLAVQLSSRVSSVWAGTWLCTNRRHRSGSRPQASNSVPRRRVALVSSAGSYGSVIACRSTTQKIASWRSAAGDPAEGWSSTQRRTAPMKLPRCMSPVGWIPENTRATAAHTTGDVGVSPGHSGGPEVRRSHQAVGYPADMPYEVSTPVFEGPFDLLLHLILKEEVDLWEISLARIVDAFCAEVERMQRLDLESATEFLLIAATLVELKARRLLPGREDMELDEELSRFEERDLLLAR